MCKGSDNKCITQVFRRFFKFLGCCLAIFRTKTKNNPFLYVSGCSPCESWHDAFACKQASSKAICHSSVPLALTRIKKKNPARGQKNQHLQSEYDMVQAPTKRGYATTKRPCGATKTKTTGVYLVFRMVFPLEERGFSFCRVTAL